MGRLGTPQTIVYENKKGERRKERVSYKKMAFRQYDISDKKFIKVRENIME
jgi:hypothetical protein